jgi:hypothetical protein
VPSAAELLGLVRWKETKPTATFDGLLTIGSKLKIPVSVPSALLVCTFVLVSNFCSVRLAFLS